MIHDRAEKYMASYIRILASLFKARTVVFALMTVCVGFVSARDAGFDGKALLWTILGAALAVAGNGALNEWIERDADAKMERTRSRPIPSGAIRPATVLILSIVMILAGALVLALRVNAFSAAITLAGAVIYNFIYTPLKYRSALCTYVGAISGSLPPVMGWAAAAGRLDWRAAALGILLFFWQLPHSFSLSFLYRDDYEKAGCVLFPAADASGKTTGRIVFAHCLLMLPASAPVWLTGLAGWTYFAGAMILGCAFSYMGYRFRESGARQSARLVFHASLTYLPMLLALVLADAPRMVPH